MREHFSNAQKPSTTECFDKSKTILSSEKVRRVALIGDHSNTTDKLRIGVGRESNTSMAILISINLEMCSLNMNQLKQGIFLTEDQRH